MNIKQNIKHFAAKFVTHGLKKFSNLHKGESCYILGDGPSIKWFDLSLFNNHPAICCGMLPFHNDFNKLNVKYLTVAAPWLFVPKLFKPKYMREFDLIGAEYKRFIQRSPDKEFFINLSNRLSVSGKNINYIFRRLPERGNQTDKLLGRFNLFISSFQAPLAIAYYLGFSKVYLVGFDGCLFRPSCDSHWYEKGGVEFFEAPNSPLYFLEILKEAMDIYAISVDGVSQHVKNMHYKTYTGKSPIFRENHELLSVHYLKVLGSYPRYKIF